MTLSILLGAIGLLCFQCAFFTAWAIFPITATSGWCSLRVQYLLSFMLKSAGLGMIFAMSWAWRELVPLEIDPSTLRSLEWLRLIGIGMTIVGVSLTLRALTRERCGEFGWFMVVLFNVIVVGTWSML